jgi:hypothetical protein
MNTYLVDVLVGNVYTLTIKGEHIDDLMEEAKEKAHKEGQLRETHFSEVIDYDIIQEGEEETMSIELTASEILDLRMALTTRTAEWLEAYDKAEDALRKQAILQIVDSQHELYEKLVKWHDAQKVKEETK